MELKKPSTDALRPIIPDNACILCITAAAGTELADAYSWFTVKIHQSEKKFTTLKPSSFTRYCLVKLSPIAKYSPLLPPVGVCSVLNPSVAIHLLKIATDRCLGKLLPHQQANQTQAHD